MIPNFTKKDHLINLYFIRQLKPSEIPVPRFFFLFTYFEQKRENMFQSRMGARTTSLVQFCFSISTLEIYLSYLPAFPHQHPFCLYIACSLVGFWTDKPGWCWFVVRGKHCWLVDKPWLKPTNEQTDKRRNLESYIRLEGEVFVMGREGGPN